MGYCVGLHPVCEKCFFWLISFAHVLLYYFKKKRKRKISKKKEKDLVSLAEYFDLVWCLYNDLWGTFVFPDDTYDLHLSTQVIGIWRIRESRKNAGKDHSTEILVVCVKIEEIHSTGIVGIHDYSLNNHVLVAHYIRDLAYGDESRIKDLKSMVNSEDPQYRKIFETVYWRSESK